ncbi:CobD/CbiB family cobalamin biosynthesis protein [Robbsia sp. KACC 23696]|uniref:CobD/CbiB family cobalamin biosynthesis protein n=1 Tax=Robbsia sp. KACC 23696 TaxID=3149231 RepID=UPI00325B3BB3
MIGTFTFLAGGALAIVAAGIDRLIGEPSRWHPLVGFGRLAADVERRLNAQAAAADAAPPATIRPDAHTAIDTDACAQRRTALRARVCGLLGWGCLVVPPTVLAIGLIQCCPLPLAALLHALLLWFALGARSLRDHIAPVATALAQADLRAARAAAARVVSRDLTDADETAVAKAAVESALENGSDAIFAPLFWFLIGGGPAALAYRLINTLDAMWGYRTPRLRHYGWAAARIDDVANWVPARLTALTYLLLGASRDGWHCWRTQAPTWDSPNAGPVMAAGAGSLRVRLGGTARYHGHDEYRPVLGCGAAPVAIDVQRALDLVQRTLIAWLALSVGIGAILAIMGGTAS